jgi:preprotein translocase subunit SecA
MKIFEEMWSGVSDKVTDLVFRMEQLDPDFLSYLGSRWQLDRAQAIHQAPEPEVAAVAGGVRAAQDAAIETNQSPTETKKEPVRNTGRKVGRNDPCPCGSGKKFKACHMNKAGQADLF